MKLLFYNFGMKLSEEQILTIQKACERVDYGSVTIKMNKTAKFIDVVIENQIRLQNEPTNEGYQLSKERKY